MKPKKTRVPQRNERDFWRTCASKVRYRELKAAKQAVRTYGVRVYVCPFCKGYHTTTKEKL